MEYLGMIIIFIVGLLIVNVVSLKFTLIEKAGLSFVLGLGAQTLLMLFMDLFGIKLSAVNLLISGVILIISFSIPLYLNRKNLLSCVRQPIRIDFKSLNLIWLFFVVLIVYFEIMNFTKCMYYPTIDKDSLTSFDMIGYVMGKEGTLKNATIFQSSYMPHIHDAGSTITYAPMVQLSYAYVYALGASTSKLIPALMYLFFLIAFYGSIRRVTGHTGAAITTFFMMITPDMLGFSSLSATNVMHAISASLGIIYIALWFRYKERKDLYLAGVLLGINVWCRTEGIVFIGAAFCVIFVHTLYTKKYKDILPILCSFIPAVVWGLFMKINGLYAESIAIMHLFYDPEKITLIYKYMKSHFENTMLYGWTFIAFVVSFVINIPFLIKRKNNLPLLCMIILGILFYTIVIYQIDYKWDSINNVLAYSAKRFLYCFVPIMWFYSMTNETVLILLKKLEGFLTLKALADKK